MKNKWIIVLIAFSLLIAGGILEQIYFKHLFGEMSERFENLTDESGIFSEQVPVDMDSVAETREWLKKKNVPLEMLVTHRELNEIEYVYAEIEGALRCGDYRTANQQLFRLRKLAEELYQMFAFRLGNVI